MARAKTRTRTRTITKYKTRFRNIGGKVRRGASRARRGFSGGSTKLESFMADIGIGSTVAIVANEVKPTGLPKFVVPAVAGGARFLTKSGGIKEKAIHGIVAGIDAYVTDRLIKNEPIIPSLGLTSGSGGGITNSGFTVVS
jgi:hypothetical protein